MKTTTSNNSLETGQCRTTSLAMVETTNNDQETSERHPAAKAGNGSTSSKVICRAFDDLALEDLYLNYCQRWRESDLDCFFLTGCLVAVHTAVSLTLKQLGNNGQDVLDKSNYLMVNGSNDPLSPEVDQISNDQSDGSVGILICASVSSVVAVAQASLGFYIRGRNNKAVAGGPRSSSSSLVQGLGDHQQAANHLTGRLTYAAWLLANVLILGLLALIPSSWTTDDPGSARALTWLLLVNFLTFVTLPLRLRVCLCLTGIASFIFLLVSAFHHHHYIYDPSVAARPSIHQQVVCFSLNSPWHRGHLYFLSAGPIGHEAHLFED